MVSCVSPQLPATPANPIEYFRNYAAGVARRDDLLRSAAHRKLASLGYSFRDTSSFARFTVKPEALHAFEVLVFSVVDIDTEQRSRALAVLMRNGFSFQLRPEAVELTAIPTSSPRPRKFEDSPSQRKSKELAKSLGIKFA